MMYQLLVFFLLFLTWVIFSGFFDPFHLTLGAFSCALVTWMSSHMLFENRSRSLGRLVRELFGVARYLVWLLWQIVLANVHILRLALSPAGMRDVEPSIIRFRTGLRSDFAKYVLAQSITLTPGTVTVKIEGDEFVVHAISRMTADGLDGSMERKIASIFESEQPLPSAGATTRGGESA